MKNTSKVSNSPIPPNPPHLTPQHSLIIERLPGYFLILCLGVSFFYLFKILAPFLTVIFVAGVLTIAFYPLYKKILKWFRGWERSASLVTCLIVMVLTVLPITFFAVMLADEGVNTYQVIKEKVDSGVFDKYLQWEEGGFFYDWKEKLEDLAGIENFDLKTEIVEKAKAWSDDLIEKVGGFVSGIFNFVLNFFIMLFSMYYFFKDGRRIVEKAGKVSPLPSIYEGQLFEKISAMVKAILVGVFLTAILQGFVGGIGFAIAGVSSPIFWGTAMAFFSLVPLVGTAMIWVPASIILAILGSYGAAIFIFLWGFVLVGTVDNFVRPFLIGGKAHTYPLLTFFVILGGIFTMSFKGVIIGPLVLMLLMSFLHIYESEYSKVLKK